MNVCTLTYVRVPVHMYYNRLVAMQSDNQVTTKL
jgi:hypothetical protein